ncbi:MAG: acetyl-CoA carboxylase biotin carboxylase subunit, partial [Cetobacterium sp.]
NITFIGPSPEAIESMGDKATARKTAIENEVPLTNGTGIVRSIDDARKEVEERIGYPVMIKATAGGGGKGMRLARTAEELESRIIAAQTEAESAFGNPDVYIEKFVENPRHVEIQIIGDKHGNVIHLGERDCSIQRRHQKLIEEAPSYKLPSKVRKAMGEAAVKLAKSISYDSAGTLEFLVDKDDNFYFMEMNTRVQVEHTVTEMVTGIDIIKLQIKVAEGERINISQEDVVLFGHAIECRINAEDTKAGFLPSPGKLETYIVPGGPGVRVDSHSYSGYEISPYYDSMIGKLIVHGITREEAIEKMKRALNEFIIEGIDTTIPFHLEVLDNKVYRSGKVTTKFIEENFEKN